MIMTKGHLKNEIILEEEEEEEEEEKKRKGKTSKFLDAGSSGWNEREGD